MLIRNSKSQIIYLMMAIALIGGCNRFRQNPNPVDPPNNIETPVASPTPTPTPAVEESTEPRIYWLEVEETGFALVPESIELPSDDPEATLTDLLTQLFTSTPEAELTSTIPQGTELLGLTVEQDGVYVDLSAEFTAGGGSASMIGRVAQVLYTASSLDPQTSVWFSVEGEPLEVLGGEGLIIDQPMTRKLFTENFDL